MKLYYAIQMRDATIKGHPMGNGSHGSVRIDAITLVNLQKILRQGGMSAIGAQQLVNGLPIGQAGDRQALTSLLVAASQTGGSGHG